MSRKGRKIADHIFEREGVRVVVPLRLFEEADGRVLFTAIDHKHKLDLYDSDIGKLKSRVDEVLVRVLGINLEVYVVVKVVTCGESAEDPLRERAVSFVPFLALLGVWRGEKVHAVIPADKVDENCVWRGDTSALEWLPGWPESSVRVAQPNGMIKTMCVLRATPEVLRAVRQFSGALSSFASELHDQFAPAEVKKFLVKVLGAQTTKAFDFGEGGR
jgi:hypothetical protein